ncbi:MAG: SlyX family protein [Thiotrichales bacterium]
MSEERITELECRIALQEDQLDSLSRSLHEQQQEISTLLLKMAALEELVKALKPSQLASTDEEAPPPHY